MFVARAAPVPPRQTNSEVYYAVGENLEPPPADKLTPTTNPASLSDQLTRLLGVSPNLHVPPPGQSRDPLEATIQHAKFFCFQYQDEIAKKDLLFHRQGEHFVAQAVRDTLPYFLGAVPEDGLKVRQELREAKRALKMLERRLAEAESLSGAGASRAAGFVREAMAAGLLPAGDVPRDAAAMIALLRTVRFTPAADESARAGEDLQRLRRERADARREYDRLAREVAEAEEYAAGSEGFAAVADEQQARLESIHLMASPGGDSQPRCPLCQAPADQSVPRVAQVRQALADVERHVTAAKGERPDLTAFIAARRREMAALDERLRTNREATDALAAQDAEFRAGRDRDIERARVDARIGLFLESAGATADDSGLRAEVGQARRRVVDLEARLCEEESEDLLASALNRVNDQMTRWCADLKVEYGKFPLRLDRQKLTVIADTDAGPVPMPQMGSGQNWLWKHLTVYFALHKLFIEQGRPVPRFLFLDQPTQVCYPPKPGAGGRPVRLPGFDPSWEARLFRWINDRVTELGGKLQVIVTDHAEVAEPWFAEAVVERWRDGAALVPDGWPRMRTPQPAEE